ncbi:transposase [Crenobacter oryzisoli]|uniref:transposase n=1 Tax=Crenobacter oryzisoli TaxID=3056844 RepID=UPI0033901609
MVKRGSQPAFSDAVIQFDNQLPVRSDAVTDDWQENLLRLANLEWPGPDFSRQSHRQKVLQVRIPAWQRDD